MLYFKHSEIADTYHVSLSTVHNWIIASKSGKLSLSLIKKGARTYIANTAENTLILQRLAEQGKKKRNSRFHKIVRPTPVFYELYSQQQIYDIITNLRVHHEIPRQYNYFDGGASNWDAYANRLQDEDAPNLLNATITLLKSNYATISELIKGHKRVNIVDLGPGNALPVKELLEYMLEQGVLNRYIAVDISEEMLHIAQRNIHQWFEGRVAFEGYVRDITHERFGNLVVPDMLAEDGQDTINLVLLLGGTLTNFRTWSSTLATIYGSMGPDDLFMYTCKPDTEASRRYFSFNPSSTDERLSRNHRLMFDMLNIDEDAYDVEMGYDDRKRMRYIRVRFRHAVTIEFAFGSAKQSLTFDKGETILLWRAWHKTSGEITDEFEKSGFTILQSSITQNRQFMLTIAGIDQNDISPA